MKTIRIMLMGLENIEIIRLSPAEASDTALLKLASINDPSTIPRTIGATEYPFLLITKPIRPKMAIIRTSNTLEFIA